MKDLHAKVQKQLEKVNESYARNANKGRKLRSFKVGDWVWLHLRKERFPQARKNKLAPRGDGPFQITKKIGENAYVLDLPNDGSYNVHATFNVCDLAPFEGELEDENPRTDSSQEGGYDEDITTMVTPTQDEVKPQASKIPNPLQGIGGPMTRSRFKKVQESLNTFMRLMAQGEAQEETQERTLQLHHLGLQLEEGTLSTHGGFQVSIIADEEEKVESTCDT